MIREINLIEVLKDAVSKETLEKIKEAGIETYSYRLTELPTKFDYGSPRPAQVCRDIVDGLKNEINLNRDELMLITSTIIDYDCNERNKIQMSLEASKQEEN